MALIHDCNNDCNNLNALECLCSFNMIITHFVYRSIIDKFSDLKNLNISKETKIYRHSWKQRAKISITAKFEEEIL